MLRTPSSGGSTSVDLSKVLPRRQERVSGYIGVCNKGARQSKHQRLVLSKENQIAAKGKMQASGLPESVPFICISAIWGRILLLDGSHSSLPVHHKEWSMWWMAASCMPPRSSAVTVRDGGICGIWIAGIVFPFGSPHSRLESWNHWWLWHFLPTDMSGNISFHNMKKLSLSGWEHDPKLKWSNRARNWISICPWDCTLCWIFTVWICSTVFPLYAFGGGGCLTNSLHTCGKNRNVFYFISLFLSLLNHIGKSSLCSENIKTENLF